MNPFEVIAQDGARRLLGRRAAELAGRGSAAGLTAQSLSREPRLDLLLGTTSSSSAASWSSSWWWSSWSSSSSSSALLHKKPWALIGTLAVILVMVFAWRTHVYQTEGLYQALLRTNARMDAPLSGALAACLTPYARRAARWASPAALGSLAVLLALSFATVDDVQFFRLPGDLVDVALAVFVVACTIAPVSAGLTRVLGFAPLALLGRRSLSLYIWHFPIYMYLYHHTESWSYQLRTAVALVLTVTIAVINDRTVEHWVGRSLVDPRWSRVDRGIPTYLGALAGATVRGVAGRSSTVHREPVEHRSASVGAAPLSDAEVDPPSTAPSEQLRPTHRDGA